MPETTTPLHDLLPAQVYRELKYKLRDALPDPPTGDPEDVERRLHTAIAEIAAYAPAGAAELNLAFRYVDAAEAASECLHLARQAARDKSPTPPDCAPSPPASCARLRATTPDCSACKTSAARLRRTPRKPAAPSGLNTAPSASWPTTSHLKIQRRSPPPHPSQSPTHRRRPKDPAPLTEAERYAVLYPERAARIRRFGPVLPDLDFDPPDPELAQALATASGPIFTALDRRFPLIPPPLAGGG